ncbi:MAG: pyruvate, phosphate dikinase [candidate division Zixibacteria bacterium]|nr:pyruvate, phosphate dikinase [candidate division Zixibacteria bacterium]
MNHPKTAIDRLLSALQERTKELNCLYRIEEILSNRSRQPRDVIPDIMQALPSGWQHPERCQVKITFEDHQYTTPGYVEPSSECSADIVIQNIVVGTISVSYPGSMPVLDSGPFLKEEIRLTQTVARRLGHYIMHQKMHRFISEWKPFEKDRTADATGGAQVVLELLRQTDPELYLRISRRMLNQLCWNSVPEAERLLHELCADHERIDHGLTDDQNRPQTHRSLGLSAEAGAVAFKIAADHFSEGEILTRIHQWVHEDKLSFLSQVINRNLSLAEVADAIDRYNNLTADEPEPPSHATTGVQVALIRRFLSDQLQFINVGKHFITIRDFSRLLDNVIFSPESYGKLGGKSAGIFLASRILERKAEENKVLGRVHIPKTWYLTSDILLQFMHYNNFDEVVEQKYKPLSQVRLEYPNVVQSFKGGRFSPDIRKGLALALDDFGNRPLIVRSSSLLEDRIGTAFSGKYISLFLANQGSKQKRLDELTDAIAEVYASTFGPDPIEYRAERGLIDFAEEMGIIIQEVVGTRVGPYFLPSYAGVAFSRNEFRWSPRIRREDGLIRMVPGLGTRAVDRLSDDYPVLIAPGQPGLRTTIDIDDARRYSPNTIDLIDLTTHRFESIDLDHFLKKYGCHVPGINNIVSILSGDTLKRPTGLGIDFDRDQLVANFEGLTSGTNFVKRMQAILQTLEEAMGMPVDVEFASDGKELYLLQCRPQSYSDAALPDPIPKDIPSRQCLFSADRYVSNGRVPDIMHIVYVDPLQYAELKTRNELLAVGRAVGKLNSLLTRRKFILMGPGRWGSRGDIKLGVSVTYSDINNTAVLIEIARRKAGYVPDLSFGTHFFQDLVEGGIRYLPLYPDDPGIIFNERFLTESPNALGDLLPEFASLDRVVRVIDVPRVTDGMILRVLMNADLDEAVGMLVPPSPGGHALGVTTQTTGANRTNYWQWRTQMAERLARELDGRQYGVAGLYLFGSSKNATAGPASDINLLVHVRGTDEQLHRLELWMDGWSRCLAEANYIRTGYRTEKLLDVHYITDDDIANKSSFAVKIGAVTDAAAPLPLKSYRD